MSESEQLVRVGVWLASDGSGDLFFDGDEWAKERKQHAVIFPMSGGMVEPSLWKAFVEKTIKGREEWDALRRAEGKEPFEHGPIDFYPRTFHRTEIPIPVKTREWPAHLDLDDDAERLRLAQWKVLFRRTVGYQRRCAMCDTGDLFPDGRRFRCDFCEHGPSDWQRTR